MVPGTLAHSMNRGCMSYGLSLRVLELAEGTHRLQFPSPTAKGGHHGCWFFSSHWLLNKGQHGDGKKRNRARVVPQPKKLEEALVEVGDWNVWIDLGLGWVVRKMKTQGLELTKRWWLNGLKGTGTGQLLQVWAGELGWGN